MTKFGEKLKELRQEKHLTQDQLAEKTGISQGSISAYELNKAKATVDVVFIFCKYFGVSADFMLGLED